MGDDAAEFLRRHRVSATPKELNAALARAVAARRVMLRELAPSELTEGEIEVLRAGGFLVEPCFPPGHDPLTRSIAEFAALIKTSITVPGGGGGLKSHPTVDLRLCAPRDVDRDPEGPEHG